MRIFRGWTWWLAVLCVTVAVAQDNLVQNPGFESDGGWDAVAGKFERDADRPHGGRFSVRVDCAQVGDVAGVMQTVIVHQKLPHPLRLSVWTRAAITEGRPGAGYSLWADVDYIADTRPGRVDLPGIRVDCEPSTEWRRFEVLINPEQPIRQVRIHGLFRRAYRGSVWFDDFELVELDRLALGVDRDPPPLPLTLPAEPVAQWVEAGGLSLGLAADGRWAELKVAGTSVLKAPAGLAVGDFRDGEWHWLTGAVEQREGRLVVTWSAADLHGTVTYQPLGEGLEVAGEIVNDGEGDRAIDLLAWLPVASAGLRWARDLDTRVTVAAAWPSHEDLPLAAVDWGEADGLGLALAPAEPCCFHFGVARAPAFVQAGVAPFYLRLPFGLALETKSPGTARFRFLLAATADGGGLRELTRRWYAAWPDSFTRRATKEGLWQFAINTSKLPNPTDYGYHEGSPAGVEEDASHGILTMPYLIPTQLALYRMPQLPDSVEEVEALLEQHQPSESDRGGAELVQRIRHSVPYGPDGRYPFRARDDVGADIKPPKPINNVVFDVNPDPDLFADRQLPTAGQWYLDAARGLVEQYPRIGGVYLDSMTGWVGRRLNYRRQHFAYLDVPLTHDAEGRVCVDGRFHAVEFMRGLGQVLHPQGKLVFPNLSITQRSQFYYPVTDVIGLEGHGVDLERHRFYRQMACQKPVLRLDYLGINGRDNELTTPGGMSWYVHACAHWGIEPSIGRRADEAYRHNQELFDTWLPVIRKLSAAGWEPIPYATAEGALVERFGSGPGCYLSLLNPADEAAQVRLRIETRKLGVKGEVRDVVSGKALAVTREGHDLVVHLPLAGRMSVVVEVK